MTGFALRARQPSYPGEGVFPGSQPPVSPAPHQAKPPIAIIMHAAVFGDWWAAGAGGGALAAAKQTATARDFAAARPFPNMVIDGFFSEEMASALEPVFPEMASSLRWHRYDNPIEKKFARDDVASIPAAARAFAALQSEEFLGRLRALTGIEDLEADPHLHGAGLHYHPRGGKLDMHLDYSLHPVTGRERRLNLIVYLNRGWREAWGGAVELWDESCSRCERSVLPEWNRAIIFRTSHMSFHGLPRPIRCPAGTGRKSLAIYYMAPWREGSLVRPKAEYRPLPGQPVPPGLAALYAIRARRRIEERDLAQLYPGWRTDEAGRGYWWAEEEEEQQQQQPAAE